MRISVRVFLYVALIVYATRSSAQELPVYLIHQYGLNDGLEIGNHAELKKDDSGYLWLITDNSLTRFDGHHFMNYYGEWNTPCKPDQAAFTSFDFNEEGKIYLLYRSGLYTYDKSTECFIHVELTDYTGRGLSGHSFRNITYIQEDSILIASRKTMFICSGDDGRCENLLDRPTFQNLTSSDWINRVLLRSEIYPNSIYIMSNLGLFLFNLETLQFTKKYPSIPNFLGNPSIIEMPDTSLIMCYNPEGLMYLSKDSKAWRPTQITTSFKDQNLYYGGTVFDQRLFFFHDEGLVHIPLEDIKSKIVETPIINYDLDFDYPISTVMVDSNILYVPVSKGVV